MDATTAPRSAGDFDEQASRLAALGEPMRRALYRFVTSQTGPVDREQAATALGIARHTAKFHLDRLEADGLLDADYARPHGRSGPGAGRPAKRYRRSGREIALNLPERRYDLVGHLMAQAIDQSTRSGTPVADALRETASAEGRALGTRARSAGRDPAAKRQALIELLAECGYEPHDDPPDVVLGNCPFHRLAERYPELVCGTNLEFIRGVIQTSEDNALQPRPEPAQGCCCVRLVRTSTIKAR